jgi:phosphoserine phosphatase RsbU/P
MVKDATMSIRWKSLILLLLMTLIPLVMVSYLERGATWKLGSELADSSSDTLAQVASEQLLQLVRDYSIILRREIELMELAVMVQRQEAERLLASTAVNDVTTYYAHDFDMGVNIPNIVASTEHASIDATGEAHYPLVSYQVPSIYLAPGVEAEAVESDAVRLGDMALVYRELDKAHPELMYWQFTSLENGVHSSFPGHGGYPENYDARLRPWYEEAMQEKVACWIPPVVDASTRKITSTIAAPIRGPEGNFVGVTAIDVPISKILFEKRIASRWSESICRLFIESEPNSEGEEARMRVLASSCGGRVSVEGGDSLLTSWVEAESDTEWEAVISSMSSSDSGCATLVLDNENTFFAFSRIADFDIFLAFMLPHDRVVQQAEEARAYARALTKKMLNWTYGIFVGLVVLVILAVALISRSITQPLLHLSEVVNKVSEGDLEAQSCVSSRDEIGKLCCAFNSMVPQLRDRMRMRQALSLAMDVQQHLLPSVPPQLVGFDIAGESDYCDETGGDYYDFIELTDLGPDMLGVAVGDVAGHGIASALLMTTTRALLRSQAEMPIGLAQTMININRHLSADTTQGRFMTLFCMVIDAKTRRMYWTNAGHHPAVCYSPQKDSFSELSGNGVPLGIDPKRKYEEYRREDWEKGEVIMIGTDGIWELRNTSGEMFGKERWKEIIRQNHTRTAQEIINAVTSALTAFRGEHPQEDDITMVVLKSVS